MPELSDYIQSDAFKKASPEEQQKFVMDYMAKYPKGKKEAGEASLAQEEGLSKMSQPGMNTPSNIPGPPGADPSMMASDTETSLEDRVRGGLGVGGIGTAAGLLAGGGGAVPGGVGGFMSGFMFPPKSKGQWAASVAAAPLGALGGKLTGMIAQPALRTGAAGLEGLLSTIALNGVSEAVDQRGDKIMPSAPQALLSSLLPMAGHQLINSTTESRPLNVSRKMVEEVTGQKLKISDLKNFETLQQNSPEIAQILLAGKEPTPAQIANMVKQSRLEKNIRKTTLAKKALATKGAELDLDKAVNIVEKAKKSIAAARAQQNAQSGITDIQAFNAGEGATDLNTAQFKLREANRYKLPRDKRNALDKTVLDKQETLNEARAELVRQKAEQDAYGDVRQNATGEAALENAKIDVDKKGNVGWRKRQLEEREAGFKIALEDLKKDASNQAAALHPDLAKLTTPDVVTGNDLMRKLGTKEISASGIDAYRQKIEGKLGAKGVKDFEDGMVAEIFRQAYDPNTKTLSNAPKIFDKDGGFTPEKIMAIYGNGAKGKEKLDTIVRMVDAIRALGKDSWYDKMLNRMGAHAAWVLPNIVAFHPEALANIAGGAAVVGGTAMAAVGYPKLIDMAIKNPKLGESFYRWATSTSRTGRSLANWPRLAAWLKSNSEPVTDEEE